MLLPTLCNASHCQVAILSCPAIEMTLLSLLQSLSYLPFAGPVDLANPVTKLCLFEYYGLDNTNIPEEPYRVNKQWILDCQRSFLAI